jgi:hypothetical protein
MFKSLLSMTAIHSCIVFVLFALAFGTLRPNVLSANVQWPRSEWPFGCEAVRAVYSNTSWVALVQTISTEVEPQ